MASGLVCRANRPNTWLHRPACKREEKPCQLGAVHTWHKADMLLASLDVRFSNRPSGSSTFRLSTNSSAMSLTGSRFSSDSAPRPFHHGIRRRGGTIFWATLDLILHRSQARADLGPAKAPAG